MKEVVKNNLLVREVLNSIPARSNRCGADGSPAAATIFFWSCVTYRRKAAETGPVICFRNTLRHNIASRPIMEIWLRFHDYFFFSTTHSIFQVTVNLEGGKLVAAGPEYRLVVEVGGGKLKETITLKGHTMTRVSARQ